MPRTLLKTLLAVIVLAATHAEALGLGEITLESALNQPLAARIQLVDTGGVAAEDITVRIASAQDFTRFSLDRPYFLDNVRLSIESNGNGHYIRVSSTDPVREPYLAFVLDTRWPSGRTLTEYTVLLDPPAFASQSIRQHPQPPVRKVTEATAAPAAPAQPVESASAAPQVAQPPEVSATPVAPAAPEPPVETVPAETAPEPRQTFADTSRTVTVGDNDTLWEIALRVRPDNSFSVQQTMLALQRANPEAFIADNINLVRRGQVLRIPDASEIRNLGSSDAVAEVGRQNQLFASRQAAPTASEPLAAPPASATAATDPQGELRVVTAEDTADQAAAAATAAAADSAALDQDTADMEDRLAISREELDRVDRENAELTERLSMLQEQIASAQELLRLRDLELAQLQQSLAAETGDSAAASDVPAPPAVTMAPEAGAMERILNQLLNNPVMIGLILALLVALTVLLLLRRNKSQQAALADEHEDEDVSGFAARAEDRAAFAAAGLAGSGAVATPAAGNEEASSRSLEDDLRDDLGEDLEELYEIGDAVTEMDREPDRDSQGEQAADDGAAAGVEEAFDVSWDEGDEQDGRSTPIADSEIDQLHREQTAELLAEVDALIAHEEYQEAQGVLQDAIVADPNNVALRVKLLEVFAAEHDETAFGLQESELSRLTMTDRERATVENLRLKLVGGDVSDPGQDQQFAPGDISKEINDIEDIDDMELELDMEASPDVDDSKVLAGLEPEVADADQGGGDSGTEPQTPDSADDSNEIDFDFDLDLDLDEDLDSDDDALLDEEQAPELTLEDDNGDGSGVSDDAEGSEIKEESDFSFDIDDFDLDLDDEQSSASDGGGTDELQGDAVADSELSAEPAPVHETDALEDLEFTPAVAAETAETGKDIDEDDEFQFLSDSDEAGTKLDLARAYIDMDDVEGAREILEEVLEEGTEAQVAQARELLDRLG